MIFYFFQGFFIVNIASSVTQLAQVLITQHLRLSVAESCTGGGLAYHLTSLSGSSDWFERGIVSYSNLAKQEILGVQKTTLEQYGAVSKETAKEMAEGCLEHSAADLSLSITGIAGPSGGSPEKPVGTVWFAWTGKNFPTQTRLYHFTGDRQSIREQAIETALEILLAACSQSSL
jgi:nicotinamide-nucleotide amidase